MTEDVWILGIHMTKFGKHPDKDTVDLAAEAVTGALADGGVTMKDIGVIGARQPHGRGRHRPGPAEADRPDRHPRLQRVQRLRHRGHRPAGGGHGRQVRRGRLRPGGRRREARRRRPAGRRQPRRRTPRPGRPRVARVRWPPSTAGSGPTRCRACSPRSAWSTATSTAGRASSCSPRSARRTTPTRRSTRWPPTRRG